MLSSPSFRSAFVLSIKPLIKHKYNYGTSTTPCMWTNEIKIKTKPNQVTFKMATRARDHFERYLIWFCFDFDFAHKQYNGIIK